MQVEQITDHFKTMPFVQHNKRYFELIYYWIRIGQLKSDLKCCSSLLPTV